MYLTFIDPYLVTYGIEKYIKTKRSGALICVRKIRGSVSVCAGVLSVDRQMLQRDVHPRCSGLPQLRFSSPQHGQ